MHTHAQRKRTGILGLCLVLGLFSGIYVHAEIVTHPSQHRNPAVSGSFQVLSVEPVSVNSDAEWANETSEGELISADGRYIAFSSSADNLVPNDTNGKSDVFVRDRQTGQTERVSMMVDGQEATGDSYARWISGDGRHVVFSTVMKPGLFPVSQLFVAELQLGEITDPANTPLPPLETPDPQPDAHELLVNRSFEVDSSGNNQPDDWRTNNLQAGDRMRCNRVRPDSSLRVFAHSGECAYQFRKNPNPPAGRLRQVLRAEDLAAYDISAGHTLAASAYFSHPRAENAGAGVIRVFVRYSDLDDQGLKIRERFFLNLPAPTDPPLGSSYAQVVEMLSLESGAVELIRFDILDGPLSRARYLVDDVSLLLSTGTTPTPVMPIPADASDFAQ